MSFFKIWEGSPSKTAMTRVVIWAAPNEAQRINSYYKKKKKKKKAWKQVIYNTIRKSWAKSIQEDILINNVLMTS